jgi:hypothetical protein
MKCNVIKECLNIIHSEMIKYLIKNIYIFFKNFIMSYVTIVTYYKTICKLIYQFINEEMYVSMYLFIYVSPDPPCKKSWLCPYWEGK